ncbi:MAG TPA: GTPase HflX, partial [Planctomycetaceae bacterium]|nr:GTPase HflX [Planctomycetaceae bacterium]
MELKRTDLSLRRERVVLVRVVRDGTRLGVAPLGELARLARTARAHVVGEIVQRCAAPDPTYYVGRGKLREVQEVCRATDADAVICDDDLSASQVRKLEDALGLKVLDRSELILDVFATRAQTRQAKLQVELAQLEYALPRLMRMWTHLSRVEGGIGMRGPGERQLETDRRLVRRRIQDLKRQLARIERRREQVVRAREDVTTVALVDYTNAGKSTLLNALTGARTLVEDKDR